MTQPTFTEATPRQRTAMLKTAADPALNNPRAKEIRESLTKDVAEKLSKLTPAQLSELVAGIDSPTDRRSPFWTRRD